MTKTLRAFFTFVAFATFGSLITVGHILREISQHVDLYINTENRNINGRVKSLKYRPLDGFMNSLYGWDYTGLVDDKEDEENSDRDYEDFVINAKDDERDNIIALD